MLLLSKSQDRVPEELNISPLDSQLFSPKCALLCCIALHIALQFHCPCCYRAVATVLCRAAAVLCRAATVLCRAATVPTVL